MSRRTQAYLALTLVSAIWGIAAIVIKYTLNFIEPFSFLAYRFWLSFLIVLPFFYSQFKKHGPTWSEMKETLSLTFIGIPFNLILVFLGINLTSALEASFILATAPLFTVLGGWIFLNEKIEKHEAIGLIVASVGTLIIVLEPVFRNHSINFTNLGGNFVLLSSVITLTYYTVRSRRDLNHRFSPWFITMIGFLIAPIFLTPLSLVEQPFSQLLITIYQLPLSAHLGVFYMAVISGVAAYFLFQYGLKRIEASEATIFQYLSPVFGAPLAVFWLGDQVTRPFFVGTLVVMAGVFVAEYKPHRRKHFSKLRFWSRPN